MKNNLNSKTHSLLLKTPLSQSIILHIIFILIFLLVYFLGQSKKNQKMIVPIQIKEVVQPKEIAQPVLIQTSPQKAKEFSKIKNQKKIFGINKNTLTSNQDAHSVTIKSGNTLAKDIDQEHLNPEDAVSLPIPTDEYLISKMPKIKNNIIIPYPSEARKNNIEGLVLLEILIDETGKVRDAKLVEGPGHGLNEAALEAIYRFEFSPALVDEKPVPVKIKYGYRFVLN